MSNYSTVQRSRILSLLRENSDQQYSAKRIADSFLKEPISLSAVYRNLSLLEQNGAVVRIVRAGEKEKYYQYIDTDSCRESIHLVCLKCGSTIHLNNNETEQLIHNVLQVDGFVINKPKTILYGVCSSCQ